MITDIRARVVCSLGPVISGDISDDYIQGNGVIKTSGSLILSGIFAPAVGQKIELGYISNINGQKVAARIPRTLRVLSSFSDPFKRITTVEIGCLFTYLSDKKPPPERPVSVNSDEVDEEEKKRVIVPVRASTVLAECFSKLGINYSGANLTNIFAVEKFDFSAGYVDVISDLLVSEGQFCYLDASENAVIVSNEVATPGGGPSLEGRDIIEASPIGTGEQPADNVSVNYNYKRFKKPKSKEELIQEQKASGVGDYVPGSGSNKSDKELEEEADAQIARTLATNEWEYERQISIGQDIKIDYSYTIIPLWDWEEEIRIARAMSRDTYAIFSFIETSKALFLSKTEQQITGSTYWPNYSITTVSTRYDEWDRVIYRETLVERGVASVAATAISEYYSRQIFGQINAEPCYERQVENFKYLYNSKKDKTGIAASPSTGLFVLDEDSPSDDDFNSLIEKETLTYQCFTALRDALIDPNIFAVSTHSSIKSRKSDNRYTMGGFDGEPKYLTRRVVELYGKRAAEVVARNSGVTDNTGDSRSNPANFTTEQVTITYIASFLSENGFNSNLNFNAQKFWNLSQINSINRALEKENLVLDNIQISQKRGRMGTESRPNRASRLAAAYAKQVKGDQKAVLELDTNAAGKDTYKELTIPYVSDDILSYDPTTDTYTLQQSDAEQKALNYGRTQNALLLGNRNGISIQISANLMPPRPFSSIVIRDSNVSGVYRTNGTSYTFDSNGIIASTDALFAGGIK